MEKLIAHVFSNRAQLTRHVNDAYCEDVAVTVGSNNDSYTDIHGYKHLCFVVRDRVDVNRLNSYTFARHVIHGEPYDLSAEDDKYMREMLVHRTREPMESDQ